jgi:hypothetical protein
MSQTGKSGNDLETEDHYSIQTVQVAMILCVVSTSDPLTLSYVRSVAFFVFDLQRRKTTKNVRIEFNNDILEDQRKTGANRSSTRQIENV